MSSGRELTIKREFDNRLSGVEDDARRSLERARAEAEAHWRNLAIERDVLYARLSELDPRGRWRSSLTAPTPKSRHSAAVPSSPDEVDAQAAPAPAPPSPPTRRPKRSQRKHRPLATAGATAGTDSADDLKLIKGIGPTFEQRLNEMGYSTFQSVAAWSSDDLDRLGEELGARIRLEEWSARAAELHAEKHGAPH